MAISETRSGTNFDPDFVSPKSSCPTPAETAETNDQSTQIFQTRFPWMQENQIEAFRKQILAQNPKCKEPLNAFMESVRRLSGRSTREDGDQAGGDLPIERFTGIFPISHEEAVEFAERRRAIDTHAPLATFIARVQDLPQGYREVFARRAVNTGNFSPKSNQRQQSR